MKITIVLAIGMAIGFGIRSLVPSESAVADHWRIVREYREHVLNPENYTPDPQTDFRSLSHRKILSQALLLSFLRASFATSMSSCPLFRIPIVMQLDTGWRSVNAIKTKLSGLTGILVPLHFPPKESSRSICSFGSPNHQSLLSSS